MNDLVILPVKPEPEPEWNSNTDRHWPVHPVSLLYHQLALSFKKQVKPAMPRKTKDEAELTRIGILNAALEVFNDKGVSRSTLADIASEAGVTRGAIYWHFKNKADLVHQLMEHHYDGMFKELEAKYSHLKGVEALLAISENWIDIFIANEPLQKLTEVYFFKIEHCGDMEEFRQFEFESMQTDLDEILEALEEGRTLGHFKADADLRSFAITYLATAQGLMMQWLILKRSFDLKALMMSTLNALLVPIRAEKN